MADIKLFRRLISLRSSLGTAAIGSYIEGMVERPILIASSANSSGNLTLSTLFALSLAVLLRALKIAPSSSLIFSTLVLSQASFRIFLFSAATYYINTGATKASIGCITTSARLLCIYYVT